MKKTPTKMADGRELIYYDEDETVVRLGDGTIETRTIPRTLQAIDLMAKETDLMEMYCDMIVKNKSIGLYDGAYKCVELATGKKFVRDNLITTE